MAKAKDSFIVFYEWEEDLRGLSDEQMGQLFRAVFAYEKRGEAYTGGDPHIEMAMSFIQRALDRNRERYEKTCERNRRNIAKRWGNNTQNTSGKNGIPDDTKNTERERDREREHDRDREKEAAGAAAVSFFRESVSKKLSGKGEVEIVDYCERMGEEAVLEAMRTAVATGKRSWGYVKGILNNWKEQGGAKRTTGPAPGQPRGPTPEELAENQRELLALLEKTGGLSGQ